MMQRDETLLLRPWLIYHGYLFGFENLFVFDNGSRSASALATLKEFKDLGVHVDAAHQTPADFAGKGEVIGKLIKRFNADKRYDIAVPLDCDEFLAINGQNGIVCNRTEILEELSRIDAGGVACQTTRCLDNRPGYADLFRYIGHFKSIVVVREFLAIDHGFHEANLAEGQTYGATALIHIHMHFKPYHHLLRGARNKLTPFVDVQDDAALAAFTGCGVHLTKYFRMTSEEYYNELHGYALPLLRFRGWLRLLSVLMDMGEFERSWEEGRPLEPPAGIEFDLDRLPFKAAPYLAANPGLKERDPLDHFLRAGYEEGRRLDTTDEGRWDVVERLAQIRTRQNDGIAGYAGAALALHAVGQAEAADLLIAAAIQEFGATITLLREHALLAIFQEKFEVAISRWRDIRDVFPDNPDGYLYGSMANRLAGRLDEAERIVVAGLNRFPEHLDLAIEHGDIAVGRRNWIQAKAFWESLLRKYPENPALLERAEGAAAELEA